MEGTALEIAVLHILSDKLFDFIAKSFPGIFTEMQADQEPSPVSPNCNSSADRHVDALTRKYGSSVIVLRNMKLSWTDRDDVTYVYPFCGIWRQLDPI